MRPRTGLGWLAVAALASSTIHAHEVLAEAPTDLSVTIYRAPERASGALALGSLNGFALISETRRISVPAGESRIRFEGVAEGIMPASAILTGLPGDVLERNQDAQVLSPAALVARSVGRKLELVRTDPKSGKSTRLIGTILSGPDGGVLFESADGIEALRCSGLPETFIFSGDSDLGATATLSTLVRSSKPTEAVVTLSYLTRKFDWAANYVAIVAPDGKSMDIGAWVTLGNGNRTSFPAAHAQVVAGRLNRATGAVEPVDAGGSILAACWPSETTSSIPVAKLLHEPLPEGRYQLREMMAAPAPAVADMSARAQLVQEEQLGDLKLYRVPDRASVNSRQVKQVRLLDRAAVPVQVLYTAELSANQSVQALQLRRILRTKNDAAHHLGLALPSGEVESFEAHDAAPLLLSETALRDIAVDEDMELDVGSSSDVRLSAVQEAAGPSGEGAGQLPLLPGIVRQPSRILDNACRVEIRNARDTPVDLEIALRMRDGARLIAASQDFIERNGKLVFRLRVDAGDTSTIRYQTEHPSVPGTSRP
jgi:hypothetical protein